MSGLVRGLLVLTGAWVLILGAHQAMAEDLILAKGAESEWTITVPSAATDLEKRAAEALRAGVKALTGADLAVAEAGGKVIAIVRGGDPAQFSVKAAPGRIELAGNPLAAAYALLDHLGFNQVSLYQDQGWGLSVRPPKDKTLRVPADLEITTAKGAPVRALILTNPGGMLEEFLDWMVGHGMNRIMFPDTLEQAHQDAIAMAAAVRGLTVIRLPGAMVDKYYSGPGAMKAWLGNDRTLFAEPSADVRGMLEAVGAAQRTPISPVYSCGPQRWFWDAYADAAFIFAEAARTGVTDLAALRKRYCEVAYGSTAARGLEYFALLDQIRAEVGGRDWAEAVAGSPTAYELWQKALKTAEQGRRSSPEDSAQRKRWVWLQGGLKYHDARVEALRRLAAAKKLEGPKEREAALRAALTDLLAFNQGKIGQIAANEQYGLMAEGRPVGLERELPVVANLRDALLEATGAKASKNLASGARVTVAVASEAPVSTPALTDGDLKTAAVFPADPLVRVAVDLGAERAVRRVRFINAPANMVTAFRIEVVQADGTRSTAAQGRVASADIFGWQSVEFAPQKARQVVIRVDGFASLSPGGGGGLAEVEVE